MANLSQRLKHGKALCGKVFSGFVETFNALVDFKDNIKGDDDVARGTGHISLDRKNPLHPVIRCTGCAAKIVQPVSEVDTGRYKISSISEVSNVFSITFANAYFRIGGKTYSGASSISDVELPAIVALKVSASGSQSPSSTIESYMDLASLQDAEKDLSQYIFPLYSLDESGSVECDFRIGPDASMGEF